MMNTSRRVTGEPCGSPRQNTNAARAAARHYGVLLLAACMALCLSGCGRSAQDDAANDATKPQNLVSSAESGESGDPVADCQSLAPEDPYVEDEAGAERAYTVCVAAAEMAPDDAETQYRLGLSATQSGRPDEAVESFRKAESLGNCGALYFLGDDAWYGRAKDEDDSEAPAAAERAEAYYKRGAACGDKRAAAELFSPEMFTASGHKDLIEALYNSDVKTLNRVRFASASYVAGFYDALSDQFLGKDFDPCWTTTYYRGGDLQYDLNAAEKGDAPNVIEGYAYENLLPIAFQVLMPEQGSKGLEEFRTTERKAGQADLNRMIRSSKCDAMLPYKLVKGAETFAKSKRSLLEVVSEAAPQIHSHSDLVAWLRQKSQRRESDNQLGR